MNAGPQNNQRLRSYERFFLCLVVAALGLLGVPGMRAQEAIMLVGSGSTVPGPLYAKWADEFNQRNPRVQVRYLPIGTSESITAISRGTGDFGAGEVQLSAQELKDMKLVLVPTMLIGIVPIYNLPGVHEPLRFSGEVLAEIYLGRIKNWNEPRLARLNPSVSLPDAPIKVIYRPKGKGSNYIFTDYLSKVSPTFRAQLGKSASPAWPVGLAAERSSDMVDKVSSETGTIGYVELNYATKVDIGYGTVQNAAGHYVRASRASLLAACQAMQISIPANFSVSLTNAAGAESYPLASLTWLYLPAKAANRARARAMSDFLDWAMSDGQKMAEREGYAELPASLLAKVTAKLASRK
jgi:phosphate transport system substrate-binding protein